MKLAIKEEEKVGHHCSHLSCFLIRMSQLSLHSFVNLKLKLSRNCKESPVMLIASASPSRSLHATNSLQHECLASLSPPVNQSVAAIVFGDGSRSRLYPLTKRRSEGAIPIAGNYRLIDAVVSNCINSDINKIYALTQFNSTSLNSHLSRAYSGCLTKDGFVEVIAAYQSLEHEDWFQGTADAIRRCLWVLEEYPVVEFLVLPGHHLYKMDYQKLIEAHRKNNSDVTVAVLSGRKDQDSGYGTFKVDSERRVIAFREKPETKPMRSSSVQNSVKFHNQSDDDFPGMGIYVISKDVMIKLLREYFPRANDLKGDVIPGAISLGMKVHAYHFDGYWEDMTSIEAFYQANMESTKTTNMKYSFHDRDFPVYTLPRHLPPTLVADAVITNSVIGDGCILNSCNIRGTVVGFRTRVGDGAVIEDSVIMGSDIYQTTNVQNDGNEGRRMSIPIGVGEGATIRKAIIDKNARIGKNAMIINKDNVQEANREAYGYIITDGIIVILKGAVIPDGSIL